MEWSEEKILQMIHIYKSKPLLWNPKHKDHYKKNLKEDAWREIGMEINTSSEECKKKMLSMLSCNRREKIKVNASKGTGKGRSEMYVSRWFAYEALKFLEDRDLPRMGLTTEMDESPTTGNDMEAGVMPSEQIEQSATEREEGTSASFSTPRCAKRAKGKGDDISSSIMKSALDMLETATKKLGKGSSEPNEIDSFFTYVAAKVRGYSPETQKAVQHAVFEVLMKADRGMFDWPAPNNNYQYPYNWQNPAEIGPTPPMYPQPFFSQPHQVVPPPTTHSPSEPSSSVISNPSPALSVTSDSFEDFV